MNERVKLSLTGMWLIAGLSAVILPVFLPSVPSDRLIGNPIDLALASMFALSLPSSLVAVPIAAFIDAASGGFTTRIANEYLFILLLFVMGAIQWFWLVPKIFRNRTFIQPLKLKDVTVLGLPKGDISEFDVNGVTRLERVLDYRDVKTQIR